MNQQHIGLRSKSGRLLTSGVGALAVLALLSGCGGDAPEPTPQERAAIEERIAPPSTVRVKPESVTAAAPAVAPEPEPVVAEVVVEAAADTAAAEPVAEAEPAAESAAPEATTAAGNAAAGRTQFMAVCAACHGRQGEGMGIFPPLAGTPAAETAALLERYRAGEQVGANTALMAPNARSLSDQAIADLAAFIETL